MDTTRYAKPRPCLPSLQRSRVGRARAVSLDEVSDRSLSRDDRLVERDGSGSARGRDAGAARAGALERRQARARLRGVAGGVHLIL